MLPTLDGQTDACENITFSQLALQALKIIVELCSWTAVLDCYSMIPDKN